MNRKLISLVLIFALVMSLSLVGCTSKNDEVTDKDQGKVEQNEQDKEPNKEPANSVDEEKLQAKVTASTRMAEEKIDSLFETYVPEGTEDTYFIAKSYYPTIEKMKNFLMNYYSENMVNSIIDNYVNVVDVPGKGEVPTLELPEDYVTIVGYTFTDNDTVTINENTATIVINPDEKKVTYTLTKSDNTWLIDTKTVE